MQPVPQIFWDVKWNLNGIKKGQLSYLVIDKEGVYMERQEKRETKMVWMLKSLLFSYVVTGMLLALLTVLLYKFELDEQLVSAAIVAIYVLATMAGGLVIGKLVKVRRFLWGLGLGAAYFALLMLITLGVYHTLNGNAVNMITAFILCSGGGMIGGMIS